MRILVLLSVLGLGAFGGWYFGSPVWTVYQVGEAAKARDGDRLSAYVDFPALRQSFREELRARLTDPEATSERGRFSALRARIEGALADRVADAAIDPAMLRIMLDASRRAEGFRPPFRLNPANAELVRDGFSQFSVRADNGGALIFGRRGLGWQIIGIRLPPRRPRAAPPVHPAEPELNEATAATIAG